MDVVVAIILTFIRLSALLLLTPLFAVAKVPVMVRNLFLIALATVFVVGLDITPTSVPYTLSDFFLAAIHELLTGAVMAFGLFAAFAAFLFGGRLLDFQMGFGVANLIDPATNAQGPLLGTILNVMAVMTFFLLNGHHWLIRGIAYSFHAIPVGQGLSHINIQALITQFGYMFIFGLMLVAPAVFTLLLLDVGLAIAARTMPQVNIFIVGLPLKIFVGLVVLAVSLNYLSPLMNRIFESGFKFWEQVLV
ncbi:MAG: flagellar biosynthetic protein FliR [Neptuniibacter sp.]